ncbi:MAG TPA: pyridoxal-phosphate dependent enzyme, partial [Acidimicrobiia bacterium]
IPGFYDDALAASQEHARRTGAEFAHAFDLPEVVAGAGTCALEIATQVPEVDTLLVAVGGGGLIAGVASWFRDRARVVGVETTGTPTLHAARSAGEPVQVEVSGIAVSALGAARIGDIAWEAAQRWVDESLLIEDDDVRGAQQWLWETARVVAEPAGATPIAALLSGAYVPAANETVVALISGANTSPGSVANSQP